MCFYSLNMFACDVVVVVVLLLLFLIFICTLCFTSLSHCRDVLCWCECDKMYWHTYVSECEWMCAFVCSLLKFSICLISFYTQLDGFFNFCDIYHLDFFFLIYTLAVLSFCYLFFVGENDFFLSYDKYTYLIHWLE